jgi:hypothetical protein
MPSSDRPKMIVLRAWPKMIFLWPTTLLSAMATIAMMTSPESLNLIGGVFVVGVALNLVVLTFDFPRSTSLLVSVIAVSVVLGLVLLNQQFGFIGSLQQWVASLQINASRDFYLTIFIVLFLLLIGMAISTRFDYWELSSNELIHHSGLLGDVERFSTAGLKLNTEINDIFEYILAGSGRIIMNIPGSPRPVVLNNVLRISYLLKATDAMLSTRVVEVADTRTANAPLIEE